MKTSLSHAELKEYIHRQLLQFFPDKGYALPDLPVANEALSLALERSEFCFSQIRNPSYSQFYHLHADQYASFLYFLANSIYQLTPSEERAKQICDKLLQLNRILHQVFISYKCAMPKVFYLGHPIGTVIGNAVYGENLCVFQNVTINTSTVSTPEPPRIGNAVFLSAGTQIIGNPIIGDMVVIGAGTIINNRDIPCGNIVYNDRNSKELTIRSYDTRRIFSQIFKDI